MNRLINQLGTPNNTAIIITAYKDAEMLQKIVNHFEDLEVYVHVDQKSIPEFKESAMSMRSETTHIYSEYAVEWGSVDHLKAIIFLINEATKSNVSYMHVITGQDFPLLTVHEYNQFSKDNKNIYLGNTSYEDLPLNTRSWYDKKYFNNPNKRSLFSNLITGVQGYLPFFRRKELIGFPVGKIYKGLVYGSFPREFGEYAVKTWQETPNVEQQLRVTRIPEEMYFQTVAMNSEFKKYVINDHKRYMEWGAPRNGSTPAILDITDLEKIEDGDYLFARKVDSEISAELIEALDGRATEWR
jgi:hypothetical protein